MDIEFEYFDEEKDQDLLVTASVQKYTDFGGYCEVEDICIAVAADTKDITDTVEKERPKLFGTIIDLCEDEYDATCHDGWDAASEARGEEEREGRRSKD